MCVCTFKHTDLKVWGILCLTPELCICSLAANCKSWLESCQYLNICHFFTEMSLGTINNQLETTLTSTTWQWKLNSICTRINTRWTHLLREDTCFLDFIVTLHERQAMLLFFFWRWKDCSGTSVAWRLPLSRLLWTVRTNLPSVSSGLDWACMIAIIGTSYSDLDKGTRQGRPTPLQLSYWSFPE